MKKAYRACSGQGLCYPLNTPRATFSGQGYSQFYFIFTRTPEGEAGSTDPASGEASAESHSRLTAHGMPMVGRAERKHGDAERISWWVLDVWLLESPVQFIHVTFFFFSSMLLGFDLLLFHGKIVFSYFPLLLRTKTVLWLQKLPHGI